jgi:hypothetical protein
VGVEVLLQKGDLNESRWTEVFKTVGHTRQWIVSWDKMPSKLGGWTRGSIFEARIGKNAGIFDREDSRPLGNWVGDELTPSLGYVCALQLSWTFLI